jgi:RNA polymerase sigma-70 factor, ECF subfamily
MLYYGELRNKSGLATFSGVDAKVQSMIEPKEDVRPRIIAFLPRLRRFCMALTGSNDQCDDLLQETVERALTRIEQWQAGTSLESWMFRIAQNLHIDRIRAQGRRGQVVDVDEIANLAGDDGRTITEARSELAHAQAAMATLPEEQQILLALVVIGERSYKEAAEILELPIGTVMSRISRARSAIDLYLNGEAT